ncbi:MAG TPA: EI24 domain-containing protein [Chitinophaga sp.]|uniref:EI24 domain-containing protein n=1 Tax=Chitinophaga sp. TaxID=1869181 RepID=UPI002F93F555
MFSFREVIAAIQSYGKAHHFITANKLWKWILLPGIIYCLLFIAGIYFVWSYSGDFVEYLLGLLPLRTWIQDLESSWVSFVFILLGLCIRLILMLLYFAYFKYFFLILGSPLFAYLSEKTEAILQHREFPFSWQEFLKDMVRGIRISFRNMVFQTITLLLLFLLSFIPILGWITPLAGFFIEAYFYGFSMMDYSCERHRMNMRQSITFIKAHRGMALGNGIVFYLFMFIPVIGWALAPSYAVIAATIHLQDKRLL